jgi:hypothetical protein
LIPAAGQQLIGRSDRDAWVEFGKLKYPQVSAVSWKAYLTEKRIPMLEEFVDR